MNSLNIIKDEFKELLENDPDTFISKYSYDERKSVIMLVEKAKKHKASYENELLRVKGMFDFDSSISDSLYVAGIDEVGRGPLAGPVVTACVILKKDANLPFLNDSKKLSKSKREKLYELITAQSVSYGIGIESEKVIDDINILQATYKAMRNAVAAMDVKPEFIIVDAVTIPKLNIPQKGIIKGDAKSASVAAASIIAKVTRDRMMEEYDKLYPEYGFKNNMGYGAAAHIEAIKKYGPCPIHRHSFIRNFV